MSPGYATGPGTSRWPHLWKGLKANYAPCLGLAGRNAPDLSGGHVNWAFAGTASAWSIIGSPWGPAAYFNGNAAMQQTLIAGVGLPCKFHTNASTDRMTIQALFRFTHSGSAKESNIIWSDHQQLLANPRYGYRLYVDNNTDKLKLEIANNDDRVTTFPTTYTSNTTLTSGKWYRAVVVWTGIGRDALGVDLCSMYLDGVDEGYLTITNSAPSGVEEYCAHVATQNSRIGSGLFATAPDLAVALVNVWNQATAGGPATFEDSMAIQLCKDPLAMFRRRRGGGSKAARMVSIGGTALRRMNVAVAG